MDPTHFDAITRSLAPTASRRGLLATVLGGLLGALPVWLDTPVRAGKKHGKKRRKKRSYHPPKQPKPRRRGCSDGACAAYFTTQKDRDYCEFICEQCDGNDPREFCIVEGDPTDPAKVAFCCPEGSECCGGHGGVCCGGDGRKCCGGQCRNTRTDLNHCGACNMPCAADQACIDGQCVGASSGNPPECREGSMHPICTKHPEYGACYPVDLPHICCGGEAHVGDPATIDCCVTEGGTYHIAKTRECPGGSHRPPEAVYRP